MADPISGQIATDAGKRAHFIAASSAVNSIGEIPITSPVLTPEHRVGPVARSG
jgi:hypothetical protein